MRDAIAGCMRSLILLLSSPLFVAGLTWVGFAACIDEPLPPGPAVARLVTAWDPLGCGEPHRVAVELEDDRGAAFAASAPCNLGGLTLDLPAFGVYRGRIYAWALGVPIHSAVAVELMIDAPIVRWVAETPR